MHAVHRYGLLLLDVARSMVCVCLCVCLCVRELGTSVCCVKTAELSEMSVGGWGFHSCGSKEPCIRWGSRSPTNRDVAYNVSRC